MQELCLPHQTGGFGGSCRPSVAGAGGGGSEQGTDRASPSDRAARRLLVLSPSAFTAVSQVTDTGRRLHTPPWRSHLPHSVPKPLSLPYLPSSSCQELPQFPPPCSWHPPHEKTGQQEAPSPECPAPLPALMRCREGGIGGGAPGSLTKTSKSPGKVVGPDLLTSHGPSGPPLSSSISSYLKTHRPGLLKMLTT